MRAEIRMAALGLALVGWSACTPMALLRPTAAPSLPPVEDSLLVVDDGAERVFDETLLSARWRLLRALDEKIAGRFDPAYRELRASAGLELEELFASPSHAAEITRLPVRLGVDAAILFQDILTIATPMGAQGPGLSSSLRGDGRQGR